MDDLAFSGASELANLIRKPQDRVKSRHAAALVSRSDLQAEKIRSLSPVGGELCW